MNRFLQKKNKERLEQIMEYIKCNLNEDLSAGRLASLFQMGESALRHQFVSHQKTTVHKYAHRLRMEQARKLLVEDQLAVKEIYLAVGYTERSAFTHAFTRFFGKSPSQYREELPE